MKDKNHQQSMELLQKIYENTAAWLHFAEAKNAASIVFNVTMITAITAINMPRNYLVLTSTIVIGLILSTIVALWSFRPINGVIKLSAKDDMTKNLLHYAYIASLDSNEYLKKLYEIYWDMPDINIDTVQQLEKDYCKEISENSKIAVRKQSCFKASLYIVLMTLALLMIVLICA